MRTTLFLTERPLPGARQPEGWTGVKTKLNVELWRPIPIEEYKDLYEVSNFGRVRSLWFGQKRILKSQKAKNGYLRVSFYKGGKEKHFSVHRLVAQAFIPNPDNLPQVNHKDENKENNFVFIKEDGSVDFNKSNLEWCPQEYNLKYGTRNERISKANTNGKLSKRVAQKTKDGELIKIWPSIMEIHRQTRWSFGNIAHCCRGERKSAHGFIWEYLD